METAVNKDVKTDVDSMSQQVIAEQVNRMLSRVEDIETTLIVFDSDKPITDSTGFPPVKAFTRQKSKRTVEGRDDRQKTIEGKEELQKSITDNSVEESSTKIEVTEKATLWDKIKEWIFCMLLIPALIIAIGLIYKLIKTRK